MSELLPEGWTSARLGDYLFVRNGFAFKSTDYCESGENTTPIIRISDIDGKSATIINATHVQASLCAESFLISKGDLLIAMSGATTGKTGIFFENKAAYQNQRVGNLKLIAPQLSSTHFRNHLVQYISPEVIKIAYGGAQPNISSKAIEDMAISLPPLAEQQEIATRLDDLLAQVDTIKARLDALPVILKRFRQAVLAAAVSGKLTEEWRENSTHLEAIIIDRKPIEDLESIFQKTQKHEIPAGWCWERFFNLGKFIGGGTPSKNNPEYWNGGIPWVTPKDMKILKIKSSQMCITQIGLSESSAQLVKENSLIFVVRGMILAHSFPVALTLKPLTINQDMKALELSTCLSPDYILLVLQSKKSEVVELASSSTHGTKRLESKFLFNIAIPLPSLPEQTEIVNRVEQLFAFADQIEQQVQTAQSRVDYLTQAILAKAFKGELTADWRAAHPELISGEHSAEALLEKIKATQIPNKPKRGKAKQAEFNL